jgi:phospholipase/carboxylesterase
MMSRRRFAAMTTSGLASLALGGACARAHATFQNRGRIDARPESGTRVTTARNGRLGLGDRRDGVLQVPARAGDERVPLLVLLHGAGGEGSGILRHLGPTAQAAGIAVLAPDARGPTWDAIRDDFGPDVDFLNRALARAFETIAVDPARVAIGGFSDGATYAISLGLINGSLFRRILAFSPGFFVPGERDGRPGLFVSHGTRDDILPIRRSSRAIVPRLKRAGYDVTYREFDGGHEVPPAIAREGMAWAAGRGAG